MKKIESLVYCSYLDKMNFQKTPLPHPIEIDLEQLLEMNLELFVFDGFGTLYLRDQAMPGAVELWNTLKLNGKKLALLTNSASRSSQQIALSARDFGFDISPNEVYSSGDYFRSQSPIDKETDIFHIGNPYGKEQLIDNGFVISNNPKSKKIVISGPTSCKNELTKQMQQAQVILQDPESEIFLLNPDACAPLDQGGKYEVSGAYAWRLNPQQNRKSHIFGKPFSGIYSWMLAQNEVSPDQAIMIGDTLGTDIAGGIACGMSTALCIQGNSNHDNVFVDMDRLGIRPNYFLSIFRN